LGVITFRAKAAGLATVSVDSGHVLLNDGNGTDAYTNGGSARFTITPPPVDGPEVTSTTQPDVDKWYPTADVELQWSRPAGAYGFSFLLDQSPDTIPDNTLDTTTTTTKSYKGLSDGIYYFHIKARGLSASSGFGGTSTFKIQIDTQAPSAFDIKLTDEANLNGARTISFATQDELSGIDYYNVYVDGNLTKEKADSPFRLNLESGAHVVRVVAYDKAGNFRAAELPVTVATPPAGFLQQKLTVPVYILLIMNLLILILLIVLIWLLLSRKRKDRVASKPRSDVAQIQAEIDQSLEELKASISHKLLKLTARSNPELFDKEEQVAADVAVTVTAARKKIDKKISKLKKVTKTAPPDILE
jgi:hypothetical protein